MGARCRFGLGSQHSQSPFVQAGQKPSVPPDGGMKAAVSGPAVLNARSVCRLGWQQPCSGVRGGAHDFWDTPEFHLCWGGARGVLLPGWGGGQ